MALPIASSDKFDQKIIRKNHKLSGFANGSVNQSLKNTLGHGGFVGKLIEPNEKVVYDFLTSLLSGKRYASKTNIKEPIDSAEKGRFNLPRGGILRRNPGKWPYRSDSRAPQPSKRCTLQAGRFRHQ